ncbi:MAG: DedA family protein [bacterium]|nr:DedA family protein [bacterium]
MTTLLSLFFGAFLAATILPFSSELMLVAALKAGEISTPALVFIATLGNVLGAFVNWLLGRYLLQWRDKKWFPFSKAQLQKASNHFQKYGLWSLLFAWMPVIGDPLTFAAGALSVHLAPFLILVTIGKTVRYIFIGWVV